MTVVCCCSIHNKMQQLIYFSSSSSLFEWQVPALLESWQQVGTNMMKTETFFFDGDENRNLVSYKIKIYLWFATCLSPSSFPPLFFFFFKCKENLFLGNRIVAKYKDVYVQNRIFTGRFGLCCMNNYNKVEYD